MLFRCLEFKPNVLLAKWNRYEKQTGIKCTNKLSMQSSDLHLKQFGWTSIHTRQNADDIVEHEHVRIPSNEIWIENNKFIN